jgi:hypothetical protein
MARVTTGGKPGTITTLNANYARGKGGTRVSAEKYEIIRKAILKAVPKTKAGIAFGDLPKAVEKHLGRADRAKIGSIPWYVTTVKLDLEARGLIERVPEAKPQRLRRTTTRP